jgi:polyisoprenoid-binding protein YceI
MTAALVALLASAAAAAGEGRTLTVEPSRSTVRYHIVHKMHDVTGSSSTIEGKAVVRPDGTVLAMVRVPMASFDSGERNRDADMREAVDAREFPFVVFKGTARLDGRVVAASQPTTAEVTMQGEVELRGVKKPVTVPLTVELSPQGSARARGAFEVSLDAFGVERPSLLFIRIEDACRIEVDLSLRQEAP